MLSVEIINKSINHATATSFRCQGQRKHAHFYSMYRTKWDILPIMLPQNVTSIVQVMSNFHIQRVRKLLSRPKVKATWPKRFSMTLTSISVC